MARCNYVGRSRVSAVVVVADHVRTCSLLHCPAHTRPGRSILAAGRGSSTRERGTGARLASVRSSSTCRPDLRRTYAVAGPLCFPLLTAPDSLSQTFPPKFPQSGSQEPHPRRLILRQSAIGAEVSTRDHNRVASSARLFG